jgi:cytochrome c5
MRCARSLSLVALVALASAAACRGGDDTGRPESASSAASTLAPPPSAALASALAASERESNARIPAGAGREIVLGDCLTCHGASLILQQHKDTAGWNKTVTQMIAWGASVDSAEKPVLIAYLAEHFAARAPGPTPPQAH